MARIDEVTRREFDAPRDTAHGLMCAVMNIDITVFHVALTLERLEAEADNLESDDIHAALRGILAYLATAAPSIDLLMDFCQCGSREELHRSVDRLGVA